MINNNVDLTKIYDISEQLAELYRAAIKDSGVTASGTLEKFTWEVEFNGDNYLLIFNLPSYWKYVENGRNPTSGRKTRWNDPIGDIMKWMDFKQIVPRPMYTKGLKTNRCIIPTKKQVAYMIVQKIHKRGFYDPNHQGKHLLENSLDQNLIDALVNEIAGKLVDTQVLPDINAIDK